jgi:flagellin FlaB
MMKNNQQNDNIGSIGIGAMIVFIALILVAAVASAVIIQTGEKLQQNAQQTGSDTQREIGGKITINGVKITNADDIKIYFEPSPGSGVLNTVDIAWQVSCDNGGYNFAAGAFGDGDATNDETGSNFAFPASQPEATNDGGDGDFGDVDGVALGDGDDTSREAITLTPGQNYVIELDLSDGAGASDDCAIADQAVNNQMTLWIHVEGGGSTYETMTITDKTAGSALV